MVDLGVMHYINAAAICELVNRLELFCILVFDAPPPPPASYIHAHHIRLRGRRKVLCVYTTCNTSIKIKTCTIYIQVFVLQ